MPATSLADTESAAANAFIARWQGVTYTNASKLASPQSFVTELCALLGVPAPLPSGAQDYQFERPITFQHGDASTSAGRPQRAMTLAIVKVLPEPVTPSKVWYARPSLMPSTSLSIAAG